MGDVIIAAFAGSIGAVCRYSAGGFVQRRTNSSMPLGTFAVNMLGAFLLGMIAGANGLSHGWSTLAAGFMGGFTTFSTWMVETSRLGLLPKPTPRAVINLTVMAALGVALAAAGFHLTN